MKIAVDVDDVLLQLVKRFLEVCNDRFGRNLSFEDADNYDFWKKYGIQREEVISIFISLQADSHLLDVCDENCTEYIEELKKRYDIDILTVRPESVRMNLLQKLDSIGIMQGSHYDKVIFVPFDPKDAKISLFNYDIYIDDNPNLIPAINNLNGKLLLLYDKPWNRDVDCGSNTIRVKNWNEIYNVIKDII